LNGTPREVQSLTVGEHFLSKFLGQAAYKETVSFDPHLRLTRTARPVLAELFPLSLAFCEGS
jgi:hypothetical protein